MNNPEEKARPRRPRRDTRAPRSTLERGSSIESVLERRREADREMMAVLAGAGAPAAGMPSRVTGELGFVLHCWNWSETSLLIDALTARYGRVFLVARGARRPSSQYRGLLTEFCPLKFSWSGRREAKMLSGAEWQGTMQPLTGEALMSAFYINELVMKLTERESALPGLFEAYAQALHTLAEGEREAVQPALRRFEMTLLGIAGWRPAVTGHASADRFAVREGVFVGIADPSEAYPGETLYPASAVAALTRGEPPAENDLRAARDILRELIRFHLDGRALRSRQILAELRKL
jgi:DNA repair protein RecO (recombination protein O)